MSVTNWNNPGRPTFLGPVITDRASRYAPIPEPGPIRTWRDLASCADAEDPEAFFPDPSDLIKHTEVIDAYCGGCPVKEECLAADLAVTGPRWGIRGGLSAEDRAARYPQKSNANRPLADACRQGHPYTPDNTGRTRRGYRYCITCNREKQVRRREAS